MSADKGTAGLAGIVAGQTAVSSLADGLSYRGYAVEELAEQATYEQVAYLLLHGEAPTPTELAAFRERIAAAIALPDEFWHCLYHLPRDAKPMDVLRSAVSLLSHWSTTSQDNSPAVELLKAEQLLGQVAVVMAGWYRISQGKSPIEYQPALSLAENLLRMIRNVEPTPLEIRALDVSLILYAEHEFNASTFTARVVASTLADYHAAITAAIGALKGPLHGGANERVLEILQAIPDPDQAESWLQQAFAEKRLVMGFGHRVYKEVDPRSTILSRYCAELAKLTNNQRMEETANRLEAMMRREKKLPANVDWPSARLYHYLRLPVALYTPLFVAARVAGWSAHIMEQHQNNRIIRPAAEYIGVESRSWAKG
jgi:2-methylcitrate synthase/citrate synthase II